MNAEQKSSTEKATHTPGPWTFRVEREADENCSARFFIDGPAAGRPRWVLAETKGLPPSATEEAEANARLIAAAPDLLAALKAIVEHQEIDGVDGGRIRYTFDYRSPLGENARAAVAKAEGEV